MKSKGGLNFLLKTISKVGFSNYQNRSDICHYRQKLRECITKF